MAGPYTTGMNAFNQRLMTAAQLALGYSGQQEQSRQFDAKLKAEQEARVAARKAARLAQEEDRQFKSEMAIQGAERSFENRDAADQYRQQRLEADAEHSMGRLELDTRKAAESERHNKAMEDRLGVRAQNKAQIDAQKLAQDNVKRLQVLSENDPSLRPMYEAAVRAYKRTYGGDIGASAPVKELSPQPTGPSQEQTRLDKARNLGIDDLNRIEPSFLEGTGMTKEDLLQEHRAFEEKAARGPAHRNFDTFGTTSSRPQLQNALTPGVPNFGGESFAPANRFDSAISKLMGDTTPPAGLKDRLAQSALQAELAKDASGEAFFGPPESDPRVKLELQKAIAQAQQALGRPLTPQEEEMVLREVYQDLGAFQTPEQDVAGSPVIPLSPVPTSTAPRS